MIPAFDPFCSGVVVKFSRVAEIIGRKYSSGISIALKVLVSSFLRRYPALLVPHIVVQVGLGCDWCSKVKPLEHGGFSKIWKKGRLSSRGCVRCQSDVKLHTHGSSACKHVTVVCITGKMWNTSKSQALQIAVEYVGNKHKEKEMQLQQRLGGYYWVKPVEGDSVIFQCHTRGRRREVSVRQQKLSRLCWKNLHFSPEFIPFVLWGPWKCEVS